MGEKTTNPNGRSDKISVIKSTNNDEEQEILERWMNFFDGGILICHSMTPQFDENGKVNKKVEILSVPIGPELFIDRPVTPLKEAQTTQVGKGNDKRSTSASKNVKSTSGEEGYRNGTSLEEQGGTSLEKQDGSKGNNPMSKQNPQNPTNHRRGKRPTSTLNSRTSNKSGDAKNVEGAR